MNQQDLEELLNLEKKLYHSLNEALALSHELDESVLRDDHVSLRLILSMRQKTILDLQEINSYIQLKRIDLNETDTAQFDRLLSATIPTCVEETPVFNQISVNRRLHSRLCDLDRKISQKFCGKQSFYHSI